LIATLLRRLAKILFAFLLLAIVVLALFRLAAALRETATRKDIAPSSGHPIQAVFFFRRKAPRAAVRWC